MCVLIAWAERQKKKKKKKTGTKGSPPVFEEGMQKDSKSTFRYCMCVV